MANNTPLFFKESTDSDYCSDVSHSVGENSHNESTPFSLVSRKRKAYFEEFNTSKSMEVIESCPPTPPFSSTLNESLMNTLERFHLQNELQKDSTTIASLHHESTTDFSHYTKVSRSEESPLFVKTFSQITVHSRSPSLKYRDHVRRIAPTKKCLFSISRRQLFRQITSNTVIMNKILKELSNGDLFRLAQVTKSLKYAILFDIDASNRYKKYMEAYNSRKENYRITPPSSPEKNENEYSVEASPATKNYQYFFGIASGLNKDQSLIKCPKCSKASVVEHNIAYCQAVNNCGYIFCRKCSSFAYNPKDFRDKCNNLHSRSMLGDLSNSNASSGYVTDMTSSFLQSSSFNLNMSSKYDSSGIFSECEYSTPRQSVKRNLSKSFGISSEPKIKILSSNNRNIESTPTSTKPLRRTPLLPVLPLGTPKKKIEISDPPSPPRAREHIACSKQSKRNLKRLTR